MIKKATLSGLMILATFSLKAQIDGGLLLGLVPATTAEMNTITNPVEGSLIYNSDEEKMYMNTASGFAKIPSIGTGLLDFWSISGNSGTNTTHFLGTTDNQDMIFKTNNVERLRFSSSGNIGVNTDTPDAQLDIESTSVPLRIQPSTSTPTGTQGGQIFMGDDGILYVFDGSRSKWLSVDRVMIGWGRNSNNTTDEYLRQFNGSLSDENGWRMIRNGTITAITAQTNASSSWTLEIRKNDDITNILILDLTSEEGKHNNNVNIDVNEGDFIQAFCNGTDISNPQTLIEIAWRK